MGVYFYLQGHGTLKQNVFSLSSYISGKIMMVNRRKKKKLFRFMILIRRKQVTHQIYCGGCDINVALPYIIGMFDLWSPRLQ